MAIATNSGKEKYRKPRTGEQRKHRMPLRIDRLSAEVKAVIVESRAAGMTWQQTAEAASLKAGQRLGRTTVQRWYDLRIAQPEKEAQSESLRRIEALIDKVLEAVRA